eukprot:scaffold27806_cov65-Phaeocystis_antarctica.AAC.3
MGAGHLCKCSCTVVSAFDKYTTKGFAHTVQRPLWDTNTGSVPAWRSAPCCPTSPTRTEQGEENFLRDFRRLDAAVTLGETHISTSNAPHSAGFHATCSSTLHPLSGRSVPRDPRGLILSLCASRRSHGQALLACEPSVVLPEVVLLQGGCAELHGGLLGELEHLVPH